MHSTLPKMSHRSSQDADHVQVISNPSPSDSVYANQLALLKLQNATRLYYKDRHVISTTTFISSVPKKDTNSPPREGDGTEDQSRKLSVAVGARIVANDPIVRPITSSSGFNNHHLHTNVIDCHGCHEAMLVNDPLRKATEHRNINNPIILLDDLRRAIHFKFPSLETNTCFCGYFSSEQADLTKHLEINPCVKDETQLRDLTSRIEGAGMCENCLAMIVPMILTCDTKVWAENTGYDEWDGSAKL